VLDLQTPGQTTVEATMAPVLNITLRSRDDKITFGFHSNAGRAGGNGVFEENLDTGESVNARFGVTD
jgi:hypothetical protein